MNPGFAIHTPTMTNPNSGSSWRGVKVAMLVRNFAKSGGLELYAYKLIDGLLSHGLDITVICQAAEAKLEHPKLKVVTIPIHEPEATKAQQLEHYFKEFSGAISRLGPFDIIHSHHIGAAPVDVVTFHNHSVFRGQECGNFIEGEISKLKLLFRADYKMRQDIDSKLTRSADVLIFPSTVCKKDFSKHFRISRPESLVVAYPGWELADEIVKQGTSALADEQDRQSTILFVGRGYRKKGLDVLLSACSILKKKHYSFKLIIAGLNEKALDRWRLRYLGLRECVSYLGFQNEMDSLYKAASIIALPSRLEPFGMAALQGMAHGLVPVVSKVSGIAELLTDQKDGLILGNHMDANELAQKLAYLLDNPDQLSQLSKQAELKAKATNWQATVDTTLGAYKQVFQRRYIV